MNAIPLPLYHIEVTPESWERLPETARLILALAEDAYPVNDGAAIRYCLYEQERQDFDACFLPAPERRLARAAA